jgi:hypothetical protein
MDKLTVPMDLMNPTVIQKTTLMLQEDVTSQIVLFLTAFVLPMQRESQEI